MFYDSLKYFDKIPLEDIRFEMGHLKDIEISLSSKAVHEVLAKCNPETKVLSITLEDMKVIVDSTDFLVARGGVNLVQGKAVLTASNVMLRVVLKYRFQKEGKRYVPKFSVDQKSLQVHLDINHTDFELQGNAGATIAKYLI